MPARNIGRPIFRCFDGITAAPPVGAERGNDLMLAELIDRRALKLEAKGLLRGAQVSPKAFVALYMALILVMDLVDSLSGTGALGIFVMILVVLLALVLQVGFLLYCMAIRRGERSEFLTLFDGFSLAGKVVALYLLEFLFIFLWSLLFTIPGIVAAYRYRFAIYNLCENPEISPLEAINMSKRQTLGYKSQLFGLDLSYLGWSILSNLPLFFYNSLVSYSVVLETWSPYVEAAPLPVDVTVIPLWVWTLLIGLWSLAVSLFYLHVFQATDLAYFETAKRTSGVGQGVSQTPPWGRDRDPDGLDGI